MKKVNQFIKKFKTWLSFFSFVLIITQCDIPQAGQTERISFETHPNVILIITDDIGFGDLGCYGNPRIKTPTIDSLYMESIRLNNFHVTPLGASTRAGLITGRDCNRTGVWSATGNRHLLHPDETTMSEVFKQNR